MFFIYISKKNKPIAFVIFSFPIYHSFGFDFVTNTIFAQLFHKQYSRFWSLYQGHFPVLLIIKTVPYMDND